MKKRSFFGHYKTIFVNEFKGYNASKFLKDVLAGITVAAVALPLAIAFGSSTVEGLGPSYTSFGVIAGMITAIFAGLVMGALGGGSFQISGPTGAMTVILGSILAKNGVQGMFMATMLAGIILLVAGLLRFGKLIQFIPRPVIVGFTSGIAVVIALGQLGNCFGIGLQGENVVQKVVYLFQHIQESNWKAIVLTVVATAIIFIYPKKLSKYVPGSLVSLIIVTLLCLIPGLNNGAVDTIGSIKGTLINSEVLNFKAINGEMLISLISPAFTIAVLGMIESLLCGVCASKMKNEPFDSNVELVAQGVGNIVIPFFGGVPATAAIARTAVAVKSGGQTRITSIMQSVVLIVCIFALPSVIAIIPKAALAGVLFATAWKMNEWKAIKEYFSKKKIEAIILYIVTLVCTVLLDLTYAILIGVVLSLIIMVINTKVKIEVSPIEKKYLNVNETKETAIVYVTGSLFFANAGELEKQVKLIINNFENFIFVFRGVTYLDVSSIEALTEMIEMLNTNNKQYEFTGVSENIYKKLEKDGFTKLVGEQNFYKSLDRLLLKDDGISQFIEKE